MYQGQGSSASALVVLSPWAEDIGQDLSRSARACVEESPAQDRLGLLALAVVDNFPGLVFEVSSSDELDGSWAGHMARSLLVASALALSDFAAEKANPKV